MWPFKKKEWLSSGAKTIEETRIPLPAPALQAVAEKKLVCQLLVRLKTAGTLSWTSDTWASHKKFYLWYLGRPDSKQFVLRCNGPNKKPMQQLLLREEIVYFETSWIEEPKKKEEGK